jgi:CRP/FNR family transcriptional regulator
MVKDSVLGSASQLLDGSSEAVYITDPHGTIEYVNPAFEALSGYGSGRMLGSTPAIMKSGHQTAEFYRSLWSRLKAGQEFRGVLLNRRRDGSLFHEEKTIRPLFDEAGRIAHFMSFGHDVSQRRDLARLRPSPKAGASAPQVLRMLDGKVPMLSRRLRRGDIVYCAGQPFRDLHILLFGLCKLMIVTAEGHEEMIAMLFKGDWLGFDGLANGRHGCTAVAADAGEVWSVRYEALVQAGLRHPELLNVFHAAMARQSARQRDDAVVLHSLPADGRMAAFLCRWADDLARCGMRNDQIMLPTSRAEIGGHIGLRLESVSRAIASLEREHLIHFESRSRRNISIPDLPALREYVHRLSAKSG